MGNLCGTTNKLKNLQQPLLDDDSLGGGNSVPKQFFDSAGAGAGADIGVNQTNQTDSVSSQVLSAITKDGSQLIMTSGPIQPFIQNGKINIRLRSVYFEDQRNPGNSIYIIYHDHSDEFHMSLEKSILKSMRLRNYAEFLNDKMSEADFKKSLIEDFPKYYNKLWKIISDGRVSARLYK